MRWPAIVMLAACGKGGGSTTTTTIVFKLEQSFYASAFEVTLAGKPVVLRSGDHMLCKGCPPLGGPNFDLPEGAKTSDIAAAYRGVCGEPSPLAVTWESPSRAMIKGEPPEPSVDVIVDNRAGKESAIQIGATRFVAKAGEASSTNVYGWTCSAPIVRDGEQLGSFEPEKNKIYSPGVLIARKDRCYRITPHAYTMSPLDRPQVPGARSVEGAAVHLIPRIDYLFEPAPAAETIPRVAFGLGDC